MGRPGRERARERERKAPVAPGGISHGPPVTPGAGAGKSNILQVEMPRNPQPQPPDAAGDTYLAAERFDVYRLALEFQALTAGTVPRGRADLRSQLDRASASILLNLAEGAGRRHAADKAHFYAIARGSSMESAAILDVLRIRRVAADADCRRGRGMLIRVVQMLTRLEGSMLARPTHR